MGHRRIGWHNVGALLAFATGFYLLAHSIWAAPLLATGAGPAGWVIRLVVGVSCLAAPFLADRHTALSKAILAIGAVALLASSLLAGEFLGAQAGWLLTVLSLLPIALAAVAAFTIGPVQRRVVP